MKERILVLTPRYPYPVIGGDRLRIYYLCKALSRRFDLTLLSLCETSVEMEMPLPDDGVFKQIERVYLPKWRSYLQTLAAIPGSKPLQLAYYQSSKFARKVRELAPQYDAVLGHLIRVGQFMEKLDVPVKILEMTDAISLNYKRVGELGEKRGLKYRVYSLESKRLETYDKKTINNFDLVSLVSNVDKQFLIEDNGNHCVKVFKNGVDIDHFPYLGPGDKPIIAFIGNMVSTQNFDACRYFCEQVLPHIRTQRDISFKIIGNAPRSTIDFFNEFEGVYATGRVASVAEEVRGAFCGVCPMRIGAGIQNKVLEYMALGIPAVVSRVGLEGIDAVIGQELLAGNTPEEIANHILSLYEDKDLQHRLALNGRKFVEKEHDWNSILTDFNGSVADLISRPKLQPSTYNDTEYKLALLD